ncbi:MAG: DNA polymerase III subunit alpha, partial [Candidatus Omnitrophica bacterium]|nr:DNA polymerase III subunit alpha [Candidatus Omnitrophota bacterium]
PELIHLYRTDEQVKQLMDTALVLEGLTRHASTHAAGITIADKPLTEYAPLFKSNDDQITTGLDMTSLEHIGLLKIDMLGLRTLTVIDETIKLAEQRHGLLINLETLPLDDVPTFQMLARAETMGVFQLESSGMRDLLKKIKPSQFEDIISVIALFRPGPIGSGMLDEFMKRKHGQIPIKYEHPRLEPILKSTYGVIVFQEQVMRIASDLAGFSLAQADLLRRAMGKKISEVMEAQRKAFLDGCKANHIPERTANRIFDLMEHFAGYGFNKCVVGTTQVVDADSGRPLTVETLYRTRQPIRVLSLDEDLRLIPAKVLDVVSNGQREVFTLTTNLGRTITVTGNHPFLTVNGWKELKELKVGDHIAVPRSLSAIQGAASLQPYQLVSLAAILSEGNTCHPSGVYVYNNSKAYTDDAVAHLSQFDNTVPTVTQRDGLYEVYAGTGQVTTFGTGHVPWNKGRHGYPRSGSKAALLEASAPSQVARSGVRQWVEELGLAWVKSTEKFIPDVIFTLPSDQMALFLGKLWSGDGHLWGSGSRFPFYATSSRRLAFQVQHLLSRLGIVGVVKAKRFKYRGGIRPGYVVYFSGKEHIVRFIERIGPHLIGRDEPLRALRQYYRQIPDDQSSKDVIPAAIKRLVHRAKERSGLTWRQLERSAGLSMKEFCGALHARKGGFRRSTIQRLGEFLEEPELVRYAASDVYWDRIRSIEAAGIAETYDLEIEHTHNFVADDLIVHNSHSAAYALISFRTAYLKTHYPVEFMTALLSSETGNTDKLVVYLDEAKRMGLTVLPPDVNESQALFTAVDAHTIRCGLGVIKNVGMSAIESLVRARERRGRFASMEEVCHDADLRLVNRKVCESLIKAGACDRMGLSRAALLASLDQAMEQAISAQKDRLRGQMTLFDELKAATPSQAPAPSVVNRLRDWPESQKLAFEKALLGFYVSGHPLARYERALRSLATATSLQLLQMDENAVVTIGGMLTKIKLTTTKKTNEQMAVCMLEDLEGDVELLVFPNTFAQLAPQLKPNAVVFVEGRIAIREDRPRLVAQQIIPIEQGASKLTRAIELVLHSPGMEKDLLEQLKGLLAKFPGVTPITLRLEIPREPSLRLKLAEGFKVEPRQELLEALSQLLGDEAVVLKRLTSPKAL